MNLNTVLVIITVLLLAAALFLILAPRFFPGISVWMTKTAGDAYQKRMFKQIQKKYPLLAERIQGFEMTPASQNAFQNAMKKLPPNEGMKLQTEFNRLRDNFVAKHPEVQPLFAAGDDGRAQGKAFNVLMKLPAEKRQALEKDLLWAWDQLRRNSPKAMGNLESAFRKKTPVEAAK
jgi:hypothetical protein